MHARAKVWWATAQVKRGRDPASYVRADRVRAHVEELRAGGWTSADIARAALVAPATISKIRRPDTKWCSRLVARDVLAVG